MADEMGVALIAGVSGIVGRGIATRLLDAGWRVIGLSRTPPLPGIEGLEHVPADLTDATVDRPWRRRAAPLPISSTPAVRRTPIRRPRRRGTQRCW